MTVTIDPVGIGFRPGDNKGDGARTGFEKINANEQNIKTAVEVLQASPVAHTHVEVDITDLGSYAVIGGAHHDGFSDYVVNEHRDWTADQGATNIDAGNYSTPGTWTPVLWDTSNSDAESQTYTAQAGHYTQIGDICFISGRLVMSSLGSLSGSSTRIGGLPITPKNSTGIGGVQFNNCINLNVTAGQGVTGALVANDAKIYLRLWDATGGTTNLTVGEMTATTQLTFNGWYKV